MAKTKQRELDDGHKSALVLAGYHWVDAGHGLSTRSYLDGEGVYIGSISLTEDGGLGWMVGVEGRFEGCIREMGKARYPTKGAACRALEEIAYALFASGIKL